MLCDKEDYKLLNCNFKTEMVLCASVPADSSSTLTYQMLGGLPHQGRSKGISGVKKGAGKLMLDVVKKQVAEVTADQ